MYRKVPADTAPRLPDTNSLDSADKIQPIITAPPFKQAWKKQKYPANLELKLAFLYVNPTVNPSAHLWHPIPTNNVNAAAPLLWLPKAKHSIKECILNANCMSITDDILVLLIDNLYKLDEVESLWFKGSVISKLWTDFKYLCTNTSIVRTEMNVNIHITEPHGIVCSFDSSPTEFELNTCASS